MKRKKEKSTEETMGNFILFFCLFDPAYTRGSEYESKKDFTLKKQIETPDIRVGENSSLTSTAWVFGNQHISLWRFELVIIKQSFFVFNYLFYSGYRREIWVTDL